MNIQPAVRPVPDNPDARARSNCEQIRPEVRLMRGPDGGIAQRRRDIFTKDQGGGVKEHHYGCMTI